ncbi:MAG: apolipoprotein N-acyltransferase [bacterium]|nr:apolipoprotein N-acyltransferase [candidate division KSB1 bacterium]MDH7560207.1 apolipoprotein N-acyltransferase [bacterium]
MRMSLILCLLTGLGLTLAFPPFQWGFLAYVALIPFFFLLRGKNVAETFRWSYLCGLILSIGTLYWINWVTLPGGIAAILVLPLYLCIYALLHNLVHRHLGEVAFVTIPFLWTGVEFLRSLGEIGFPWTVLAYTQTHYLKLIQFASITSVYGVSFWVVLINVMLYRLILSRHNVKAVAAYAAIVVLLFVVPWWYGNRVLSKERAPERSLRVVLVQGNIDPTLKWDRELKELNFATYERLTAQAMADSPDVIIWPETATPCYLRHEPEDLQRVRRLVDSLQVPLLTGTPDYVYDPAAGFSTYNSAFLFLPQREEMQHYAKMQLVPFGERVPYEDAFPFSLVKKLLDALELGEGNWSRGREPLVFVMPVAGRASLENTRQVRFSVPICYESVFPDLVRRFVVGGAELLVVITNDAWFGRPSLPRWLCGGMYQHARIAVFRAIENRIAIARCANTGISAFIDPYGRMSSATDIFTEAVVAGSVPLRQQETFYSRHGNIFTVVVSAIGAATVAASPLVRGILDRRQEAASAALTSLHSEEVAS